MKTFFFRLELVNIASTAAIHELQAVAEFAIVVPLDDELSARTAISQLNAHVCRPTTIAIVS